MSKSGALKMGALRTALLMIISAGVLSGCGPGPLQTSLLPSMRISSQEAVPQPGVAADAAHNETAPLVRKTLSSDILSALALERVLGTPRNMLQLADRPLHQIR